MRSIPLLFVLYEGVHGAAEITNFFRQVRLGFHLLIKDSSQKPLEPSRKKYYELLFDSKLLRGRSSTLISGRFYVQVGGLLEGKTCVTKWGD